MKILDKLIEITIVTFMSFMLVTGGILLLTTVMFVVVGGVQLLQYLLGYS